MIHVLDKTYAKSVVRLEFMIEEATRITEILRSDRHNCLSCMEEGHPQDLSPPHRTGLSREFRDLCKEIRIEVELVAGSTDPEAATRAALANPNLPDHVRASILAGQEGKMQGEPEGEQ